MKKAIFLLLLVIFASGWSPLEMIPAFKNLKADVTVQLNELFDREISIESVSGTLVNQVELNNVSFAKVKMLSEGSIIKAKKIIINYNPFKLAASSGNIVPAISKITIIEPEIFVERSIHDEWNMAGLIPKTKPVEEKEQPKPLLLSATVLIRGGYGLYVDHMGWGEDLKGKPFISKVKDLNAEVKLSGNKVDIISATATSVIDGSVATTRTTGNLNIKTGKYRFVVNANNVDIEKWGYYTMNIPHFKPISGRSDMKLTMTNPRKNARLPILFDGQFDIKGGKARIFDRLFENMNGFIHINDEDAWFKDLSGYREGVNVTANGRLYDFSVANYDIKLDIPKTSFRKISRAFPELAGIDFSGDALASIKIGGNYGHPIFNGRATADGALFRQKLNGNFNFYSDGPVLKVDSGDISAFGGRLYAKSTFDFTPSVPFVDINVTGEGLEPGSVLPAISKGQKAALQASVKGTIQKFTVNSVVDVPAGGGISAFGTIEATDLNMSLSCNNMNVSFGRFRGKLIGLSAKLSGSMSDLEKDLLLEGEASLGDSSIDAQQISEARALFKYKNGQLDLRSLTLRSGGSLLSIKGSTGLNCRTALVIDASSAEASDIKMFDAVLPKELMPITGKLDMRFSVSGEVKNLEKIDPGAFSVSGNCLLRNGMIATEKLKEAKLNLVWANSRFTLKDSTISTDASEILLNGTLEAGGKADMYISGTLSLANLKPLTFKFGRLFGLSKIACHLEGKINDPNTDLDFDVKDLRYNEILIDRMSGRIIYDGKNIFLAKPLDISQAGDKYSISGKIVRSKKPVLDLRLDVLKGNLNTAVALVDEINTEVSSKQMFGAPEQQKNITIYPGMFRSPGKGSGPIYQSDSNKTVIEILKKAENESSDFAKTMKEKTGRSVYGGFSGFLEVKGTFDDLSGALDFRVSNGTWETYSFDEGGIKAKLESGTFEVSYIYLKKGGGILAARGNFNPMSSASLEIGAANMPIDFLSVFIGKGKSFDGTFNMDARVEGPVSSLSGSASIEAYKVNLGGINLDSIISQIDYKNNSLLFRRTDLVTGNKKAVINGLLPLAGDGISIGITMEGESIGLLTLASSDISWIKGAGQGFIKITGNLNYPKFNGALTIKDAAVNIKPIESNLESINSDIKIMNNVITTDAFSAKWIGKWTQNNVNKIKLSGSFDWNKLFSKDRRLDLDLRLKDGDFIVDLPNFYRGDLSVRNFSLRGPLWLSNESPKAPKLSGIFNVSNGVLSLPDMTKKTDLPSLGLDVTLNIGKNSSVSAGDTRNLISTDLSNLILNLDVVGDNILINGTLDAPKILGKAVFNRGTVNILNREFSLMTEDRQKEVFASDLDKVKENSADFQGKSLPKLTLSAEINVKSMEKTAATAQSKNPVYAATNVLVVSRITGIPFSKEKEEGLNMSFYSFNEDATKQPPTLTPTGYDEEEVKVLLLPDFIKGPLGISEKGVADVDANSVLADYLNSRLNSYLLRNVEHTIAKDLELDSLTLEYNFGKDLKNMMTTTKAPAELSPQEAPETMYGVGAVKGFFGRLFLDVKYQQAVQEQAVINKAFLNYQITYKLNPVFSVVYYREPFSFIEEQSDYYKVTLKAGYEL